MNKYEVKPAYRYEPHILKLLEMDGFYALWVSRMPYTKTYEEAYESAESFFEACYGKRRFSNYDSFKNSVSQWQKRKNVSKS